MKYEMLDQLVITFLLARPNPSSGSFSKPSPTPTPAGETTHTEAAWGGLAPAR